MSEALNNKVMTTEDLRLLILLIKISKCLLMNITMFDCDNNNASDSFEPFESFFGPILIDLLVGLTNVEY